MSNSSRPDHPLEKAYRRARPALLFVAFFSLCINLLMLTVPLYMLQVYDRVLISHSQETLALLTLVAIGALVVFAVLEMIRGRILVRVSGKLDRDLADRVFRSAMSAGSGAQPSRDLETIRNFMTGPSLLALFDSPWTPIYIALVYLLHPWLGHVALVGAVLLFMAAITNNLVTRKSLHQAGVEANRANSFAESGSRNRDAVVAMGMLPGLAQTWRRWHEAGVAYQSQASDRAGFIAGSAKFLRLTVQVATLGIGAYLTIGGVTSPGVMIAAAIITSRALAPVEGAIAGWRSFTQAREAHHRLHTHFEDHLVERVPMPLPPPKGEVVFSNVYTNPPSGEKPILSAANFRIAPGTTLGITGPSAAGKSTIARLMVGVWHPSAGEVRLDGATLDQWDSRLLGQHVGFLPQDVELFAGTVAENIARFDELDPDAVVEAAKLAGAHEMILSLSDGYETSFGPGGENLSGGQRQRIGMARAFYKKPSLVVLDEPTSNLDAQGEAAVRKAVDQLKEHGSTVIVIAHRPTLMASVDLMMVVQNGSVTHFGPVSEVMPRVTRRVSVKPGVVDLESAVI
jgi:PrtD family type I secretion system ABC transporter